MTKNINKSEARLIELAKEVLESDQLETLKMSVNIGSGSRDIDGVKKHAEFWRTKFENLGLDCSWVEKSQVARAGHLFVQGKKAAASDKKKILFISHLDTVFAKDDDRKFSIENSDGQEILKGPGVLDAKGGCYVIYLLLLTLKKAGLLDKCRFLVAFMGDEEDTGKDAKGSRNYTRKEFREHATSCDIALGYEPAFAGYSELTVARRGSFEWSLEISAKQGHSANIFNDTVGVGCVFLGSSWLSEILKKYREHESITVNPSFFLGASDFESQESFHHKTNIVSGKVRIEGDARFLESSDGLEIEKYFRDTLVKLSKSLATKSNPFECNWQVGEIYPSLCPNENSYHLLSEMSRVHEDLSYKKVSALEANKRGAADISFIGEKVQGFALCGLGPEGGKAHNKDEFVIRSTLDKTLIRSVLLCSRLWKLS